MSVPSGPEGWSFLPSVNSNPGLGMMGLLRRRKIGGYPEPCTYPYRSQNTTCASYISLFYQPTFIQLCARYIFGVGTLWNLFK